MALPTSGAISLDDMHVEAGDTTGTQVRINNANIRNLIGKASNTTMSFNEWYGASAFLTLTAQSNTIVGNSSTSITATTPSFAAGDIALVTIFKLSSNSGAYPTTPTGFTSIATATADGVISNKGGTFYYYHRMRTCYKVLTAGDTSITSSSNGANMMSVEVYRPSAAITTVAAQDVATTSSNTINCSASSVATIAFGASGRYTTGFPTHTWGAGPTVNQALTYLRAGSYVQGASPSDVTWSSNSYSTGLNRTIFTSGYLEIS
jgi:hypothetical protein